MEKMFIVFCQHNTSHGLTADVILTTTDLKLAINTANTAETLGYEFLHSEPFIGVISAEPDRVYTKKELALNFISGSSEHYPGVYIRSLYNGQWKKEWLNGEYGRRYDVERRVFENNHGEVKVGTSVSFEVENQRDWQGDLEGVLIIEGHDFKIKTERSGTLTIDRKLDVYGSSIKAIHVLT
jgi:hypothetical protein